MAKKKDKVPKIELNIKNSRKNVIENFWHMEASGSIVLLATTLLAMALVNWDAAGYESFWKVHLTITFGDFIFDESLLHVINDGLMAIFFFVVGLEIKREFIVGELSTFKKAALPIMAALGGMLVPAGIYVYLNRSGLAANGWGIPMATDIAFAIGIITLFGKRLPKSLKIFLTALAIADDLGAVLVIAIFYTEGVEWNFIGWAAVPFLLLIGLNYSRNRKAIYYVILATAVWYLVFLSGVHATIAGILVALTIPTQSKQNAFKFVALGQEQLNKIAELEDPNLHALEKKRQQRVAEALQNAARTIQSPLRRIEAIYHPIATFGVLPLFALANAGILLTGFEFGSLFTDNESLGIILGLVLGKQIGITLFAWIAVKVGLAALPKKVTWQQIYGAAWLGGIGFTMSIFVSNLAFLENVELLNQAKLAILIASLISGIGGYLILANSVKKEEESLAIE